MCVKCDNRAVVDVLGSRCSKEKGLMQLLRCLFFLEACHQFQLSSQHIAGVDNDLADDLSRDRLAEFRVKTTGMNGGHSVIPPSLLQWLLQPRQDWSSPTWNQQFATFSRREYSVVDSTQRTYASALKRFSRFCAQFNILTPFPVSGALLCYYASYLASENISLKTGGLKFLLYLQC